MDATMLNESVKMAAPTRTELIGLLKAKGDYWSSWMVGEEGWLVGYDDDDPNQYSDQWEEWIQNADITWLPNLLALAHHPPIAETMTKWGGTTHEEWLWTINDLITVITKKDPKAVVDILLESMDATGEPNMFLFFFPYVVGAIRNTYYIPTSNDSQTGMALIHRLLDRLASLVEWINEKPDVFVLRLSSVLAGFLGGREVPEADAEAAENSLRKRAVQLLQQITDATPPSHVKVYELVNRYLHPPLIPDYSADPVRDAMWSE